jgi:transcriptional regulator with XRE-family HTH domain
MRTPLPLREMYAEEFGRHLFMARRRTGLSIEKLEKKAGLGRNTVWLLEHGKRSPRLDTICLLARALGVRPSELIEGLGEEPKRG